jgi:hypothetical protein
MLEDDSAFGVAYVALAKFERSLTLQARLFRPLRVRFRTDQLLPQQAVKVLRQAEQVIRITRRWNKVELLVERLGLPVLRVDRESANTSNAGGLERTHHHILQES